MEETKMNGESIKLNHRIKKTSKFRQSKFFILSFLLPFLIITFSYAIQGVFPFGEKHILTIDLYHQYAPFLRELRSKLVSGDSLFVSWAGGMGFNFFAVITYYLASPLNLLLPLFKESQISDAVLVLTVLKIASSGLTFYLYGYFSRKKHSWFYLAISCGYALSAYSLAYSWNIMWLDTIVLFPLAILGLTYLIRNQRCWLYVLSLSAILIVNYYTAFFVCIFLFFYYWVLFIQEKEKNKELILLKRHGINSFFKFAGCSLLSAGIACITLLPTVLALTGTSASGDVFPDSVDFFEPFIDFISRFLVLAPLSIRDGMANLYAGVIILILLPLFFNNKRISLSTKIAHAIFMFFLIISLNNNVLNFIWHGFHYPNQLPYRNSFVVIFLICSMVLTAYDNWNPKDKFPWFKMLGFWILALLFLQKIDNENYDFSLILISILLMFIYILILNAAEDVLLKKRYISLILLVVIIIELLINTVMGINSINENEYYGSRDGYLAGEYPASVLKRVEEIKTKNPNARAALWPDKSVNDPMLYGFPGLTIFSSTYPEKPVQLFANIGYDNNGINSYQNTGSNIVMDSVFGLEYKIVDQNREEQISFYDSVETDGLTALYKNKYALPLLFFTENSATNFSTQAELSSFTNQRNLISVLKGDPEILQMASPFSLDAKGCTIFETTHQKHQVDLLDGADQASFAFELTAYETGYYTIAWDTTGIKFDSVSLNKYDNEQRIGDRNAGSPTNLNNHTKANNPENTPESSENLGATQNLSRKDTSLSDIGYLNKGETAKITFNLNKDDSNNGTIQFEAARIDQEKFESWNNKLKKHSVNPEKLAANKLTADISVPNSGYLLFATTFDKGWQVKINGETVEIQPFDNSLILIPVSAGENSIELSFIPYGFTQGLIISGASTFLAIVLLTISILRNKKLARKKQQEFEQELENTLTEGKIRPTSITIEPLVNANTLPTTSEPKQNDNSSSKDNNF